MNWTIYLSPPHMSGKELKYVEDAFASNWIAPLGPHVDRFEREFADYLGVQSAAALSSGTAALHLALALAGVGPGDEVLCSTLTFVASANPILYLGASPVFVDAEKASWNLDPALLEEELSECRARGATPKALVVADILGQSADHGEIVPICRYYGVTVIEDAAEALGASYKGRPVGRFGRLGTFSFNGNKIITTSGGGMLVSDEPELVDQARFLAAQARDSATHFEHSRLGYNYRLSNVLAAIGRAQLQVLDERVTRRRANFRRYQEILGDLPGLEFMPEAPWGRSTRWLTCVTIDPARFGTDREEVRKALAKAGIEARPIWKPLHLQPVFEGRCRVRGGPVSEQIFERGLCLPSGSDLTTTQLEWIAGIIRAAARGAP